MSQWTQGDVDRIRASQARAAPRQKFGNRKTRDPVTGALSDSKLEARHSFELELRQKAGEIRGLQRQVPYALVVNGVHICDYRADFVFDEHGSGAVWSKVVADAKSPPTRKKAEYRLKFKLMQALFGVTIRELF